MSFCSFFLSRNACRTPYAIFILSRGRGTRATSTTLTGSVLSCVSSQPGDEGAAYKSSLPCCNEGRHAIRFWPSRRNFEFPEAQLGDIRQERKIEKGAAFFPQRWGYFLHLRNCQKQVTVGDLFPRKCTQRPSLHAIENHFQEASGGRKYI